MNHLDAFRKQKRRWSVWIVAVIVVLLLAQAWLAMDCLGKGGTPLFTQWGFACVKSDLLLPIGPL